MRISICGLGRLSTIGDPELATSIPMISLLHGNTEHFIRESWRILGEVGLAEESVVEVTATVVMNFKGEYLPYAVLVHDGGTDEQIRHVVEGLINIGLDVEIPPPIKFVEKQ